MKRLFRACLLLILPFTLIACSSTFRDREMDYTQRNIQNLPPLQTPPGLTAPQTTPLLPIPSGPNDYPPGHAPNMTPPGFDTVYPVPKTPALAMSSIS